ncbi:hypothetical protein EMCG_06619 [[Emmonsia] crescens]|uniref:Uncharacterized protein n=1 Tax=[Emmonsia] crescens TaxID=73230 RepID=A0A0G2IAQ3_9EURO|nr:hypothetical protein EMCG_06619 [Emmonsia crescens UAMH 3008]
MEGFCDYLSEGKQSIILIYALQNSAAKDRIKGLMFHHGSNIELSDELKSYTLRDENCGELRIYEACCFAAI